LPANTFVATAEAVVRAGATPVLVDVDPGTLLIDTSRVAEAMTSRTKVLMPAHLYGQLADMQPLLDLAERAGAVVIEDAAQSQGARQHGRASGSFGLAAGTSFYPGKNLGAYGDAGAIVTNSSDVNAKVRALRNYGGEVKYHHPE